MAEGHVELGPVDIDDTVQLLLNIDEEVQERSKHHSWSIYMVPSVYRDVSPRSYTPRVVSIGPLHHKDEHLKGFEVQKATYMHNLFHNVLRPLDSTPEQILKECVTKVSSSVEQIKACYVAMPTYSDSELVRMMVKDACFILLFLIENQIPFDADRDSNSLVFQTDIVLDMVLIENQIPFFVLQDILECTFLKLYPERDSNDYFLLILYVCNYNIFEGHLEMNWSYSYRSTTHDHILGFLQKCYRHPDRYSHRLLKKQKGYSAVELDRSRVRFSKKLDARWPLAMELEFKRFLCFPLSWRKPTLKMSVLRLADETELILRNLIIYEKSAKVPTCVTSYVLALRLLVDTPEDVAKLVKSQVIVNSLGSDEKAANLINNMLKEDLIKDFFYQDEWKILEYYYNAIWPWLMRTYFSNPWGIIGLLSGIVLFVLTVVQTVFTVVQTVYAVKAA